MINMKKRYIDALRYLSPEKIRKIDIVLVILFTRKYDQAGAGGAGLPLPGQYRDDLYFTHLRGYAGEEKYYEEF